MIPLPHSERLGYAPMGRTDIAFIVNLMSDPVFAAHLPGRAPAASGRTIEWAAKRIAHWERHGFGIYILTYRDKGEKIGFCGLEYARQSGLVDIRYGLVPHARGNGLAFEAAQACIQLGFEHLNLDKIYGAAVSGNTPSTRILTQLGMTPESDCTIYGNDVNAFSLHARAWQKCHF